MLLAKNYECSSNKYFYVLKKGETYGEIKIIYAQKLKKNWKKRRKMGPKPSKDANEANLDDFDIAENT